MGYREKDNPQFRYDYLDDMIGTIGRGHAGADGELRALPRPQVRSDLAEGLLQDAGLAVRVRGDGLPLAPKAEAEAYQTKTAEIDGQIGPLKQQIRQVEEPYRTRLAQAKYKKYPENIQRAIAIPEEKRTPGEALLAGQVIRTTSVSSAEIDRALSPEDLAQKNALSDEIRALRSERPKPLPVAAIVTDGDYRFTPDGPGDEPAARKCVKHEAIEGSFFAQGPGRYQAPPSYFLIRGDVESRGSEMKPGFIDVITYGNPPTELPPADGRTSGRRLALAEWLGSPENPLTARVIVNRIWQPSFRPRHRRHAGQFRQDGRAADSSGTARLAGGRFMKRGWSIKQMHRLMMTSEAYQMASQYRRRRRAASIPTTAICGASACSGSKPRSSATPCWPRAAT